MTVKPAAWYAAELHKELIRLGWKIATAESITAGLVASTLAERSGSSAYLRGGFVVYDIDMKVNVLGVNRELAAETNCVDPTIAKQMAHGVRRLTGCEVAIATTGYAEPWEEEGTHMTVPAHAYVHILAGDRFKALSVFPQGDKSRNAFRQAVAETVIEALVPMLQAQ